ncbi:hypothetical protein [Legionella sp.]|uniref:hypothetical protein n=1 Tax=Legionella sp. TaxID=459 RepID=UPI000CB33492|nr:hypothetical protein [Legionella sp.]PJE11605.1 MAG: hypothetical protein CK430_08715 [Legionella sp.]
MRAKNEVKFVINTKDDVLVQSHKGKLTFNGATKPLKSQAGYSCTIASRERLRTFYGKDAEKSIFPAERKRREAELILKKIKVIMATIPWDFGALCEESVRGLEKMGYDPLTEIYKNSVFIREKKVFAHFIRRMRADKFYTMASIELQGRWALFTLMDKMDQTFSFKNLEWTIEDGFEGLQQALRDNGQIIFQGKYGSCFHGRLNTKWHAKQSSVDREVYFFKPNTLRNSPWTHCVIVDQAKIIDGKPFVFFRDPRDPSIPGTPNKAYMLSFTSFIQRLSDKYGYAGGGPKTTYGLVKEQAITEDSITGSMPVLVN